MKYFTKEWYMDCQRTGLHYGLEESAQAASFSEDYFQKLYARRLKERIAFEEQRVREWNTPVDAQLLSSTRIQEIGAQFSQALQHNVQYQKVMLPEGILRDVADIRVLALDEATKANIRRIRAFSKDKDRAMKRTLSRYNFYYKLNRRRLLRYMNEEPDLHDCDITRAGFEGGDFVLEFDYSGGFSDIVKLIFKNARIIKNDGEIVHTSWEYDEAYLTKQNKIEFHALLYDYDPSFAEGAGMKLKDIIVEADRILCVHDNSQVEAE